MLAQSFEVAAVTQRVSLAVLYIVAHTFYVLGVVRTLRKAVGHEQVEHIADVEALTFVASHLAVFQLILHCLTVELQSHCSCLCAVEVKIHQQIVRRVNADYAVNDDSGIVGCYVVYAAYSLSIDHKL